MTTATRRESGPDAAARVYMLAEVAARGRPHRHRRRAACVKLFERLHYIRDDKTSEDYGLERGALAAPRSLLCSRRQGGYFGVSSQTGLSTLTVWRHSMFFFCRLLTLESEDTAGIHQIQFLPSVKLQKKSECLKYQFGVEKSL